MTTPVLSTQETMRRADALRVITLRQLAVIREARALEAARQTVRLKIALAVLAGLVVGVLPLLPGIY